MCSPCLQQKLSPWRCSSSDVHAAVSKAIKASGSKLNGVFVAGEATSATAAAGGHDSTQATTFASSVHRWIKSAAAPDVAIPPRPFHRRLMMQLHQATVFFTSSASHQQPESRRQQETEQQHAGSMDPSAVQLASGMLTRRSLQQTVGDGSLLAALVTPKVPRLTICEVTGGVNCPPPPAAVVTPVGR